MIAVLLATCRHLPGRARGAGAVPRRALRAGLRYARRDPRRAAACSAARRSRSCFFTLIVPIEIVYAEETLDTDDAGYGILLSSWGAGIVLGQPRVHRPQAPAHRLLIPLSTLAIGAAYLGMAVDAAGCGVACAFSVLGGLGNGIQWVSVMTALQEATPDDLQARITGLLESIASAMTGVGFLIGGIVTAISSPPDRLRRLRHRRDRHRRRRHDRLAHPGRGADG